MRRTRIIAVVAAALCLAPAAAAAPGKAQQTIATRLPELSIWKLSNGLEVAYMGVHKAPVVSVQVWYHAGSKDEPGDRRGMAHMFDRMMFQGTERVPPGEQARMINQLGGTTNAFTTEDATAYHDTLPSQYFDFALQLEAERMRHLLLRQGMVDSVREVVEEEIRRLEKDPLKRGVWEFLSAAFTRHPYAWEASGRIADLDKTSIADLEKFYDTYYQPNNALLIVVGDVAEAEVKAAVDKWFGPIPRGADPPRPAKALVEPPQTELRHKQVAGGQVGLVIGGFHIPEAKHHDIYALQIMSLILGTGESSRLHRQLVRTDKVARQTGCSALVREDPGLFVVFGAFDDPALGTKVEEGLRKSIADLRSSKVSKDELRKAKNVILSSFVFGLEGVAGLANQIGTSWILTGDPEQFLSDIPEFEAVDAAEIQRVAQKYLVDNNMTIVVVPLEGGGR